MVEGLNTFFNKLLSGGEVLVQALEKQGGECGTRTRNHRIRSALLYQVELTPQTFEKGAKAPFFIHE